MKKIKFLATTITAALLAAGNCLAGITVTPDRHIVSISPSELKSVRYEVYNSGPDELDIVIDPRVWSAPVMPIKLKAEPWLSLKEKNFKVAAGQKAPIEVSVTAPKGVEGEVVTMLFLCYKEDKNSPLNVRNGIPLYVRIKGTEKPDASIEGIDIKQRVIAGSYTLNMSVLVKNSGNVHIVPDIYIDVYNNKKGLIKEFSAKASKILLRGQDHVYSFTWNEPDLADGIYKARVRVVYSDRIKAKEADASFDIKQGLLYKKDRKTEK